VLKPGWADLDRGLFSISVAAELAGLHPQTLRIYERKGRLELQEGTRRLQTELVDLRQAAGGNGKPRRDLSGTQRSPR
jgi:MerR family transcriptional regulator/heat shock protein HspR